MVAWLLVTTPPPSKKVSCVCIAVQAPDGLVMNSAIHANLDDAVKGLISDERLVTDVELEQGRRVGAVQDCFIRARPEASTSDSDR